MDYDAPAAVFFPSGSPPSYPRRDRQSCASLVEAVRFVHALPEWQRDGAVISLSVIGAGRMLLRSDHIRHLAERADFPRGKGWPERPGCP